MSAVYSNYTPGSGRDSIRVVALFVVAMIATACGGSGKNASPNNQPPVVSDIDVSTLQDDAVVIDILAAATDSDGAVRLNSVSINSAASSGQTTVNADGTVRYLPNKGLARRDRFSVTVRDDSGAESAPAMVIVDIQPKRVVKTIGTGGGVIAAADGKTLIRVPPNALNEQTDITVVQQTGNDIPPELRVDGLVAVYDLGPDGSRFPTPLDVEILLDEANPEGVANSPLLLFSQDDNGIELLTDTESEVQPAGTAVRAKLTHFSRLILVRIPPILVFRDRVSARVGDYFSAGYSVFAGDIVDGSRIFTGRNGLYASAPLAFAEGLGFGFAFPDLQSPVEQLAYGDDVDFTTSGQSRDDGAVFGFCARFGRASVRLEIYSEGGLTPIVRSIFPSIQAVAPVAQPVLLSRLSIPVSCQLTLADASTAPVAANDGAATTSEVSTTIDVVANDSDPDGNLDVQSATLLQAPANGSARKDANGRFVYTPDTGFSGTDAFLYFVQDLDGQVSNPATVTVTVQGDIIGLPPIAIDDTASTLVDQPVTTAVLDNDSDPDGNLDPQSITLRTGPRNGGVIVNPDGSITYTPDTGFVGTDSYSYFVLDSTGLASNDATVSIDVQTPVNQPPVANDDVEFTPQNTDLIDADVTANDTDDAPNNRIPRVRVVTPPVNGTAQVSNQGTGNRIFYRPERGFSGTDTVEYVAIDDQGAESNVATLTITVGIVIGGNTPPLVRDDGVTTEQDIPVTIDVLSNDTDIDGQIDRNSLQLSATQVVSNGQLAINADSSVTYTPDAGFVGVDSFAYSVADDQGARSASARVDISVTGNGNPAVANPDVADTQINQAVLIFVATNDDGNGSLLDPDTIRIETPAANGVVEPSGGGILYTPDQNFVGTDNFSYSISNAALLRSAPANVLVTVNQVANIPPMANDDMANTIPDQPVIIGVTDNDIDSDGQIDPTSVAIVANPADGSLSVAGNGEVTYTPNSGFSGSDSFRYTVNDDSGDASNVATVTVQVSTFLGANLNPVDNISAAELQFLIQFAGRFSSQGIGGFYGFNHADSESIGRLEQIADYTWLFGLQNSDRAPDEPFAFDTGLQTGRATYNGARYEVTGFQALPVFNTPGGSLSVSSEVDPGVTATVRAPNAPLLDSNAQPTFIRGAYQGLATEVQYPDVEFTHMLVRFLFVPRNPAIVAPIGLIARIPKDAMQLDASGLRFREILDATARAELQRRGLAPVSGVAVVFYNQVDNTTFFPSTPTAPRRVVPLAAGRGFSVPAHQLVGPPLACRNVPVNTRCQGGSTQRMLVTNGSGDVSVHDSGDGSLINFILGGPTQPPVFGVGRGEHTIQNPANNCLLMTDSRDPVNRRGVINLLDTDGTFLQPNFITFADGPGDLLQTPRGMAIYNGDLYVATEGDGRVLQFNSDTGEFIAERVNDPSIAPRDIEFLPNGDLLVSDASQNGAADRVLLYPVDGGDRREIISSGLSSPYQISITPDRNLALANFSLGQIRFFNDGAPQLLDVNLGLNASGQLIRPFGVQPLQNGNFLVTSDRAGISVLDIADPQNGLVGNPIVNGSGRFIAPACMP